MLRIFDPYAMALSFLVGGVGFGMTFFFNDNVSNWGMEEIAYPAMAMVRFPKQQKCTAKLIILRTRWCSSSGRDLGEDIRVLLQS